MTRVLVVNHAHSQVCGIHDIGVRLTDRLSDSPQLETIRADCRGITEYMNACELFDPDVVIVNYRSDLMPWATGFHPNAITFAIAHNYDPDQITPIPGFDYTLALDPTGKTNPPVFAVGRPIPKTVEHTFTRTDPPEIGSFGFAFPHKGFIDVAREMQDWITNSAVYNLHMPEAHFNGVGGAPLYTQGIVDGILAVFTGKHELWLSMDHVDVDELVARLSRNDVNCLLYAPGQPQAGLSSALDFLIAARRPILVTDCAMFRHGEELVYTWPKVHLDDILGDYDRALARAAQLYERRDGELVERFEHVLEYVL